MKNLSQLVNVHIHAQYDPIYQEMRDRNAKMIMEHGPIADSLLNSSKKDARVGLGLFAYFDHDLGDTFYAMYKDAQKTFPDQILYTPYFEDIPNHGIMHHTLFVFAKVGTVSILSEEQLQEYKKAIDDIMLQIDPFTIQFNGLIAIQTGLLMYGYPSIDLNGYRQQLREAIVHKDLYFTPPHPMDIVHSTCVRLCQPVIGKKLLEFAEKYKEVDLGTVTISKIYLGYGSLRVLPAETTHTHCFNLADKSITIVKEPPTPIR